MKRVMILLLTLAGCESSYVEGNPLASSPKQTKLYTIMQPLCLFICSNPVSVVREDVFSGGQVRQRLNRGKEQHAVR